MNATSFNDIWNGLLQIKTRHRPDEMLGDAEGAYVQVVCKAHSETEFVELIKEYMDEQDVEYVNMEGIVRIDEKAIQDHPLCDIITTINHYGEVRFGTFHTWNKENEFFLDIIHLFSAGCDCYLQAPDLDKDLIQDLMDDCTIPYYVKIRLTFENTSKFMDLESHYHISQWIQSIEIRKDEKLLFEGYDSIEYGLFSKNMIIPDWFKNKHVEDYGISSDW